LPRETTDKSESNTCHMKGWGYPRKENVWGRKKGLKGGRTVLQTKKKRGGMFTSLVENAPEPKITI